MPRPYLLMLAAAALCGSASVQMPAGGWPTWPIARAPAELRPLVQRGDLVVVSLQGAVLSELTRELNRGGPVGALHSCHVDAIGIARRISRDEGVSAGRTSDRLRNPANAPRPWVAPIVRQYAGRRAADVDGFVVDLGDRIGLLRPIVHQAMCSTCHGPAEALDAQVASALRQRYPSDKAIGYTEGDIRGWFWVELPKTP